MDLEVEAGEPIYIPFLQKEAVVSIGLLLNVAIDRAPVPVAVLVPDPVYEALIDGAPQDPTAGGFHSWSCATGLRNPLVFRRELLDFSTDLVPGPGRIGAQRECAARICREMSLQNEGMPQATGWRA